MADAGTLAWLDQEDSRVAQLIRRHGWAVEYVSSATDCCAACSAGVPATADVEDPRVLIASFAYTVGLIGLGHPELLILGVDECTAMGVLNELGTRVRKGRDLVPGELISFAKWPHRVVVEHLPNPGEVVFSANRHYQRPDTASVPVYQLTYDD